MATQETSIHGRLLPSHLDLADRPKIKTSNRKKKTKQNQKLRSQLTIGLAKKFAWVFKLHLGYSHNSFRSNLNEHFGQFDTSFLTEGKQVLRNLRILALRSMFSLITRKGVFFSLLSLEALHNCPQVQQFVNFVTLCFLPL